MYTIQDIHTEMIVTREHRVGLLTATGFYFNWIVY